MELKLHTKERPMWLWIGIALIVAVLVTCGWLFLRPADTYSQIREQLASKKVSFPLVYLKTMPEGLSVASDSVEPYDEAVMFGLNKGDNRITVTQQARPKLMEEVSKLKDVPVPVGKAYVAKLNERTVGFLLTDSTLVMVGAAQPLDADTIAAVLSNLAAL